jgi:hypothetical protein
MLFEELSLSKSIQKPSLSKAMLIQHPYKKKSIPSMAGMI